MTAIETTHLTKRFGDKLAVDDLNLAIEQGELFALLGVGEHRVGVVHFLELVFVFGAGDIGMILAAHLAIRFFDLIVAGRLVDAQHLVVICHCSFFLVGVRGAIVP